MKLENKKIIIMLILVVFCMFNGFCYALDEDDVNTNLETLAIENVLLYPAFDNTVTSYDAEVSDSTTDLNILAIPEDEDASVEIVRDAKLVEGNNIIKINVTAVDGVTKKTYIINVYKRNQDEEMVFENEKEKNKIKLEGLHIYFFYDKIQPLYEQIRRSYSYDKKINAIYKRV